MYTCGASNPVPGELPSPKFHEYDVIVPSGSVLPVALNVHELSVQFAFATAVGSWFGGPSASANRNVSRPFHDCPSTVGPLTTALVPTTGVPE